MTDSRSASGGSTPPPLVSFAAETVNAGSARSHVACDHCGFGAWIGPGDDGIDAWCEACQHATALPVATTTSLPCPRCGEALSWSAPRFEELYGELQNLVAVLEAWTGRPARLGPLVPERPVFLTDLNPPPVLPWDPPELREAFEAVIAGAFHGARERLLRLAPDDHAATERQLRLSMALGIVHQRLAELPQALAAFDRALAVDPAHAPARLDRGALRARVGDFDGAREDFALAGDSYEADWNRAALMILEGFGDDGALPAPERIEAARAAAGPAQEFWSDPTVGRLLFMTAVERLRALPAPPSRAAEVLRAAEAAVEFQSFTDRAMVLLGFVTLGLESEWARIARPLAHRTIDALMAEPFSHGPAGHDLSAALRAARVTVEAGDPARALDTVAPFAGREDLRRYRIPCLYCGAGTIGVDQVTESLEDVSE